MNLSQPDVIELWCRLIDGEELSDAERDRLHTALNENQELRQSLASDATVHALLQSLEGTVATEDQADAREDLNDLKDCVSRLDERQREMIQAFYFRGQSADSIAEKLGQNAGAVRMLLMRIRQRLGKSIRKKLTWQGDGHES